MKKKEEVFIQVKGVIKQGRKQGRKQGNEDNLFN